MLHISIAPGIHDGMDLQLSPKQLEFVLNSTSQWNIAHGPVSSGKTIGSTFSFMQAASICPDSQIWMIGHTSSTIYDNVIRLILEPPAQGVPDPLAIFRPFCVWRKGERKLLFRDKVISTTGAKDSGAVGAIQGKSMSLVLCDEITLYPEYIIDMIDTRLRNKFCRGIATCNPSHPTHKVKGWIDKAAGGDPNYYALQIMLDDNPYLNESYKNRIKTSLSGIFYKRNYLGMWCLAEGAIFDFFDRSIYVLHRPPRAAEYWIAGIDDGSSNNFACTLIGINTGMKDQTKPMRWVEKEFVWDCKIKGRALTMAEKRECIQEFLEPYYVKGLYIDPSAAALKTELRRFGFSVLDADNDVLNGIAYMVSEMQQGRLFVVDDCRYTIREIESYVWDAKSSERGDDRPLKKDDHCFDGDTMIDTKYGKRKIRDLAKGDMVLTREGYRRVIKKHCTWGFVNEYEVHGEKVCCTSDHRFYTLNTGWKYIGDLIQSDILIIKKHHRIWEKKQGTRLRSHGMGKNTDVIRDLLITMTEDTITEQDTICIEMCGNSIMDQFKMDTIYITKTEIPLIIAYPIWNVSHKDCISNYIKMIGEQIKYQMKQEMQQKYGMDLKMGKNGIKNMQNVAISGKNLNEICSANCAVMDIKHENSPIQSFVRITVNQNGDEKLVLIMSKQLVNYVINNLQKIDMLNQDSVPVHVPAKIGGTTRQRVYDLTVEGCHEYFANNILVHNCLDSIRYAVYTHKVPEYTPYAQNHNPEEYMRGRFNAGVRKF